HTSPADVNVLLVGPSGQKVLLLSRVGDKLPVNTARLVFDDSAPALGQGVPIAYGTNAPSVYGNPVFPGPAPAGPYATNLAAFNGTNPNCTSSLYVLDDQTGDSGQVSFGWALSIIPAPSIALSSPAPG